MPRDEFNDPMPIASTIVLQDAAGTPIVSPKTTVGVAAQIFTVPAKAIAMVYSATGATRFGLTATLDGAAGQGYKKGLASTDITVPCRDAAAIYIRAEAGTVDIDFLFQTLR
jgi:hypothetical protein